jgi:hypothetical protein
LYTGSYYVGLGTAGTPSASYNLTFPPAGASVAGCLGTTGSGSTLVWVACSGSASLPVLDSTSIVEGSSDNTKQMRFSVAGLTTGTTRVLAVPDSNMTLDGLEVAQTFTGQKTFSASDVILSGVNLSLSNNNSIRFKDTSGNYQNVLLLDAANNVDAGAVSGGVNTYLWAGGYPRLGVVSTGLIPYTDFTQALGDFAHRFAGLSVSGIDIYGNGGAPTLMFLNPTTSQSVTIETASTITASYTLVLPSAPAFSAECLGTVSSGATLTWVSCGGGGGVTSVTASSPIASSGGSTPNITCSDCMTLSTTQTVSGNKTFTGTVTFGTYVYPASAGGTLLGTQADPFAQVVGETITAQGMSGYSGTVYIENTALYSVALTVPTSGLSSYTMTLPSASASGASFLGTAGAGGALSFIAAGKTVTIEYIEADGKTIGQLIFTNGLLTNYY